MPTLYSFEGYLEADYLTTPYLDAISLVGYGYGFQANQFVIGATKAKGIQANQQVATTKAIGWQALQQVNATKAIGWQATQVAARRLGWQALQVIYNTTQLRLLWEFPSRGIPALGGHNWSASNQATGDFSINNVNSDVEEEVFRSSSTSVDLTCDTGYPQGVTIDTLAILNHNLTTGAVVQLQGSKNSGFSPIDVNIPLTITEGDTYYIAPAFPATVAERNRYWRLVVSDPTNPDGYVEIGVIVFGTARIFSLDANWDNPLRFGDRHFKDVLQTEGFTNSMNDRAVKRFLSLTFSELERLDGDVQLLEEYFAYCRTSLKALVIPTPRYAKRYAVFAKLRDLPSMDVRNVADLDDGDGFAEYVSLALDWDESL